MRRSDEEIQDRNLIDRILAQALVCRLGLCRDNTPYVVPVSYGYDGTAVYFHTAREGTKIGFLNANPRACFEVENEVRVVPHADQACHWSMSYYSVIGYGTVSEIVDREEKTRALNHIMRHYSGQDWEFGDEALARTRAWRLAIEQVTGKCSKDRNRM